MVICLERGADLHTAQLMPLPLTVFCFTKIQIGVTFLVPAHPDNPGKRAVKRVCVCHMIAENRYNKQKLDKCNKNTAKKRKELAQHFTQIIVCFTIKSDFTD